MGLLFINFVATYPYRTDHEFYPTHNKPHKKPANWRVFQVYLAHGFIIKIRRILFLVARYRMLKPKEEGHENRPYQAP